MAAPSGTQWGSTINGKTRLGLYIASSSNDTQTTVTCQVWFWSRYSVHDSANNFYFDWDTSNAYTHRGAVSIYTNHNSGSGWDSSNQQLIASYSKTYSRGTSNQTKYCAASLDTIEASSGTMRVSASFTIPAVGSYTVSYNANGGSGAPGNQIKYHGSTLILSSTKPTRSGYNFKGWATSSTAETATYQPGGSYTANANVVLYAVWEIGVLVEFEVPNNPSVSIPDANNDGMANVPSVTVPITVVYETANANMDVYYRVCFADSDSGNVISYVDNSLNTMHGPTKANAFGSNPTITITSDLLKKAIQKQQNSEYATFVIQVCTGSNSFEPALCSVVVFKVNLTNFSVIDGELYLGMWDTNNSMKFITEFIFPKTYNLSSNAITKPVLYCNGEVISSLQNLDIQTIVENSYKRVQYIFNVSMDSQMEDFSYFELTDGLTVGRVYVRIVPYNKDQTIVIDKTDKSITAIEFIEHNRLFGFQKGGRVYFPNFSEIEEGNIGFNASELMTYSMIERE